VRDLAVQVPLPLEPFYSYALSAIELMAMRAAIALNSGVASPCDASHLHRQRALVVPAAAQSSGHVGVHRHLLFA
jgi:hypothetical protein